MKKKAARPATKPKTKPPLVSKTPVKRKPLSPAPTPKALKQRPKEKPAKDTEDMEKLLLGEEEEIEKAVNRPKPVSAGEALAFKFLQAYLVTLSKYDAARAVLPEKDKKDFAIVKSTADRIWRTKTFQDMLQKHLDEFGRKSRRLKQLVVTSLSREMATDHGVGSHQARVRAAEALGKMLGMGEKKVKEKNGKTGTAVLILPGMASLEQWASVSEQAQEELRRKTKEANNGK